MPFAGGFGRQLSPSGTRRGLLTEDYCLFEIDDDGDTIRTVARRFDPLPVTRAERDSAIAALEWFTNHGGTIDPSRIPRHKGGAHDFFFDDESHLWVLPVAEPQLHFRVAGVFDPTGRYLGRVELPFRVAPRPLPMIRGSMLYAVTTDDLGVAYVVRATIHKGPNPRADRVVDHPFEARRPGFAAVFLGARQP